MGFFKPADDDAVTEADAIDEDDDGDGDLTGLASDEGVGDPENDPPPG